MGDAAHALLNAVQVIRREARKNVRATSALSSMTEQMTAMQEYR
jgi:hypothetical protein